MSALKAHAPKPGATIQVIGAGLPRTATNSFCAALEILLGGPAYHVGVQSVLSGDLDDVLTWIKVAELRPYRSDEDGKKALSLISRRLDGYVATADPPLSQLVPELMELYPNAKVIVTTRDKESWATSIALSVKLVKPRLQYFLFFWLGGQFNYLPKLWTTFTDIWKQIYGRAIFTREDAYKIHDAHHVWLDSIVPKEKLFYFSVKDGWEPLCKFLDVPVPNRPFPRLNDAKSYEDVFKGFAIKGLIRWAIFFGLIAVLIGVPTSFWMRSSVNAGQIFDFVAQIGQRSRDR